MADVAWLAIVCGGIAALWSIVSTVLTLVFGLHWPLLRAGCFWQPVTYMFLHAGWMHLGLNMLTVLLFGSGLESEIGGRRFWRVFLWGGVLGGLGIGMVYTCTVSVVQKWFFDKRGFATGMMVGAFGFSLVVFTPVANYLLESVGVASTFLIFGVAFLAVCTSLSFFLAPPPADYCVGSGKVSVKASQKQYTVREMLRTRSFYLITLSLFLVLSAYFILNPQFVTLGEARGLTHDMALVGVMLAGVFSALGRLTVAWVSDRIGRIPAMLMIALLTAAGITVMIFAEGMVFLACIAVISYAFGGASGIYATVVADRFGTENMGTNYGIVMMGFGASALVFPMVSNGLSGGGDYTSSFIMVALTCLAALVCILLLSRERDQPGQA